MALPGWRAEPCLVLYPSNRFRRSRSEGVFGFSISSHGSIRAIVKCGPQTNSLSAKNRRYRARLQ